MSHNNKMHEITRPRPRFTHDFKKAASSQHQRLKSDPGYLIGTLELVGFRGVGNQFREPASFPLPSACRKRRRPRLRPPSSFDAIELA